MPRHICYLYKVPSITDNGLKARIETLVQREGSVLSVKRNAISGSVFVEFDQEACK